MLLNDASFYILSHPVIRTGTHFADKYETKVSYNIRHLQLLIDYILDNCLFYGVFVRIIFLLFMITITNAFADRAVPYEYIKNEKGECLFFVTIKSWSGQSKGFASHPNSMERTYCERMFPKRPANAFSINRDIPAKLLNVSVSETIDLSSKDELTAKVYYGKSQASLPKSYTELKISKDQFSQLAENVEWEILSELNIDAQILWDNLVSKYGAEKTRSNFYTFKFNKDERKKIRFFKKSVYSYINSTHIDNIWGLNILGNIHPLLTQTVLEIYTTFIPTPALDKNYYFHNQESSFALHYLSSKESKKFLHFFDKSTHGRLFLTKKGSIISFLNQEEKDNIDQLSSHNLMQFRLYLNIIHFLQLLPEDKCEQWGIWPGINRSILDNLTFLGRGKDMFIHTSALTNVYFKSMKACGPVKIANYESSEFSSQLMTHRTSKVFNSVSNESKKLVKLFEKMAKRWLK